MGRTDARGYREVERLGRIGRVVKELDGVGEDGEAGAVRRVGWSRSSERSGKMERREKTEMRGRDICILGVDTLSI